MTENLTRQNADRHRTTALVDGMVVQDDIGLLKTGGYKTTYN